MVKLDITRDFGSRVLGSNPSRRAIHKLLTKLLKSQFNDFLTVFFVREI